MQFHTTRWDLVMRSGDVASSLHEQSLSEFCSRYWSPLYHFARYKGFSDEDAQDLTQSFFLHLLDKVSLKHADPSRGRFRSFLLASFQNHISAMRHRAGAAKRGRRKSDGGARCSGSERTRPPPTERQCNRRSLFRCSVGAVVTRTSHGPSG